MRELPYSAVLGVLDFPRPERCENIFQVQRGTRKKSGADHIHNQSKGAAPEISVLLL